MIRTFLYNLLWPAVAVGLALAAGCTQGPLHPDAQTWHPKSYLAESRERMCSSVYGELLDCAKPMPALVLDPPPAKSGAAKWLITAWYDRVRHVIHISDPRVCASGAEFLPAIDDCTWDAQDAIDHEMVHALYRGGPTMTAEEMSEQEYWARKATGTFPAVPPKPVKPGQPVPMPTN